VATAIPFILPTIEAELCGMFTTTKYQDVTL
jgi:hypothetical protein